jgi:hypothetical protein
MSKATAVRAREPQPLPPEVVTLTIRMSVEEANDLRQIVGLVGGCPTRSSRRVTDAMWHELEAIGIKGASRVTGNLRCSDLPDHAQ